MLKVYLHVSFCASHFVCFPTFLLCVIRSLAFFAFLFVGFLPVTLWFVLHVCLAPLVVCCFINHGLGFGIFLDVSRHYCLFVVRPVCLRVSVWIRL